MLSRASQLVARAARSILAVQDDAALWTISEAESSARWFVRPARLGEPVSLESQPV